MTNRTLLLFCALLTISCNRSLVPDRSQFLRLGDPAPTIDLSLYRSVQERPGQDSSLAVVLSISGGGSRAANFAIGIMMGLEELRLSKDRDVLDEIDYLSTVSGGGFAGGAYVSALFDHEFSEKDQPFSLRHYVAQHIQEDLKRSYVAPLIGADFNPRLLFTPIDDGDALEKAIDNHVLGYRRRQADGRGRSLRLSDLFIPADSSGAAVRFPMHIANSSAINTMAIFPFTPGVLSDYQIDGYSHRMRLEYADEAFDPFDVPLAVGIKASGSFPVLISNSTLRSRYHPERPYLHLIDGAMTDNLGVYTAYDILMQEQAPRRALLIVDADSDLTPATFSGRERAVSPLNVLGGLTTSGLYARKNNLRKELAVLEASEGIRSIVFSFKFLIDNNSAAPPSRIDPLRETARLNLKMRADLTSLDPRDHQILYELTTNIGTKYTIRKDEQELLFLTGRLLVKLREDEIRQVLLSQ